MTGSSTVATVPIPQAPQRILIIKPSAIGDIVHSLPVLNLIRRRWPAAHITWLVTPACAALVENHPQIDQVIRFDRVGMRSAWRSPAGALKLLGLNDDIRRGGFDLVVDLQGLFRSGWFSGQTRAPLRVGFSHARELGWLFYTHRVAASWEDHAVERYLCIAAALGVGKAPIEFHFAVDDKDRAHIASQLPDPGPYAVLLPGANWDTKRWPPQRFSALVRPIGERFGLRCIVAVRRATRLWPRRSRRARPHRQDNAASARGIARKRKAGHSRRYRSDAHCRGPGKTVGHDVRSDRSNSNRPVRADGFGRATQDSLQPLLFAEMLAPKLPAMARHRAGADPGGRAASYRCAGRDSVIRSYFECALKRQKPRMYIRGYDRLSNVSDSTRERYRLFLSFGRWRTFPRGSPPRRSPGLARSRLR